MSKASKPAKVGGQTAANNHGVQRQVGNQAKPKTAPMTIEAASRIYRATALKNDGRIPAGSFAATAMSVAMRRRATNQG